MDTGTATAANVKCSDCRHADVGSIVLPPERRALQPVSPQNRNLVFVCVHCCRCSLTESWWRLYVGGRVARIRGIGDIDKVSSRFPLLVFCVGVMSAVLCRKIENLNLRPPIKLPHEFGV